MQSNRNPLVPLASALIGLLAGTASARQIVPPDPTLQAQIQLSIRAANNAHDWARLIAESRRLLEFFPNEPAVRAPIYLAMAEAANHANDRAQAADYRAMAMAIDPNLQDRMANGAARIDIMQAMLLAMLRIASAMPQARVAARALRQKGVAGDSSCRRFSIRTPRWGLRYTGRRTAAYLTLARLRPRGLCVGGYRRSGRGSATCAGEAGRADCRGSADRHSSLSKPSTMAFAEAAHVPTGSGS